MEKIKRLVFAKNLLCAACIAVLGAGFYVFSREDAYVGDLNIITLGKNKDTGSQTEEIPEEPEVVYLAAAVPELTCGWVEFEDCGVLFADSQNGYALLDSEGSKVDSITVKDDDGRDIIITCAEENSIMSASSSIDSFMYNGHTVSLADGRFYFDESEISYTDSAFSAYSFNDKISIECTSRGKYILRKSDGSITETAEITDDCGIHVELYANDDGFLAIDDDDFLEPALKFNDDLIVIDNEYKIYVNGEELVPPGYNDRYVNPEVIAEKEAKEAERVKAEEEKLKKAKEEKEKKKSDEDDENDGDEEELKLPNYSYVSETPLTPMESPAERGYVNKANDSVTELTLEMLGYVNDVRRQYGLEEVYGLGMLDGVTKKRAAELKISYSHTRPNEKSYESALDDAGIGWWHCGENIASMDSSSCLAVFEAWMNSEEHRSVILDPDVKYMSVSLHHYGVSTYYWDQIFISDTYIPKR